MEVSEEYWNPVNIVLFAHWNADFLQQLLFFIDMQLPETEMLFLSVKLELRDKIMKSDLKIEFPPAEPSLSEIRANSLCSLQCLLGCAGMRRRSLGKVSFLGVCRFPCR